ncbi:MAG: HD domain-containing protein [Clostridia bacterium]|nr:HD domain-containing protein [Clostridia bacterium]
MTTDQILDFLGLAATLKTVCRHCDTAPGRRESVADHLGRLGLFAWLVREEFPGVDMRHVLDICLVHDLGEAITGDIPCFEKTPAHEQAEEEAWTRIADRLPAAKGDELLRLLTEYRDAETPEAQVARALDKLEGVIAHNEADIDSWLPHEYRLNLTYATDECAAWPPLAELRRAVREQTEEKIRRESPHNTAKN